LLRRYPAAAERLNWDPRWQALDAAEEEREELYEEFCFSLQRKEDKERKLIRDAKMASLEALFVKEKVGLSLVLGSS